MGKSIKLVLIFISIFMPLSCVNQLDDEKAVDLNSTLEQELRIPVDIKTVRLETNDDCKLGFVIKTMVDPTNNRVFVLSDFNIFIFDMDGDFITKLKQGKGPNEVLQVPSFTINQQEKLIYALDMSRYLLTIDYNGNVINKFDLGGFASADLISVDKKTLLLFRNFVGMKENYFVGKFCLERNEVIERFVHSSDSPYPLNTMLSGLNFSHSNDDIFFFAANLFNLYKFSKTGVSLSISFDIGKRVVPSKYFTRYEDGDGRKRFRDEMKIKGHVPFLLYAFPFSGYFFVGLDDNSFSCYAVGRSKDRSVFKNEMIATFFNLPKVRSLRMPSGVQEGMILFACQPMDFFEHNPKEKVQNIEISGNALQVNYTDNPFLIIVNED